MPQDQPCLQNIELKSKASSSDRLLHELADIDCIAPGYCPLAVVGPNGLEKAITVETGLSDRSDNMQRFSEEALQLLISVLTADQGKL